MPGLGWKKGFGWPTTIFCCDDPAVMTQFPADDYDSPWKDVLEHAFPEFMAFYFPRGARPDRLGAGA
jgi:hypothetical protein